MKGIERVIEKIIRERISIDDMQFGFMPGRGTTDAIFILRQLQEKHLAKKKKLYFAFVDFEKRRSIRVLLQEFDLHGASSGNSCQY